MSGLLGRLREIFRTPRLRARALVLVLVLLLSFVPMAGTLGYFSSLVLAPVLSLVCAVAAVDGVARVRERSAADGGEAMWMLARDGAEAVAWLVGIALTVLTVGMLWNTNCDPVGGAAYFVLGPACSAVLGWVAGASVAILVGTRVRRRVLVILAAWTPFVVSVLIELRRLYFEPVVFAHDPFFGWFSGPIYDEGIAITPRYLGYRVYNFTIAAAVWLGLRASVDADLRPSARRMFADGPDRLRTCCAVALAGFALSLGLHAPSFGWTATRESLAEVLAGRVETEHFVIHYGPTSLTAREIEMVAAEHEFAWDQLERRLGRAPARKVESFVFASGKQRGALIGANKVEVSPPWRQEMYLSHRPWPHDVLHHELAHAFLGDVGDRLLGLPISGLRFSGALVEGLPTALAPRAHDNLGLHEQAAILDRLDKRPPLQAIMGAGFWSAAASRAYTAAGSFVLWLAQTRGWPTVAELYKNAGDFERTYGQSLAELEREWLEFLRATKLREQDVEAQAQRYQQSSVFRRPCAHRAAELANAAARARLLGREDRAVATARTLCRIEPDDPGHFLRLADMLAGFHRFDEAAEILDELATRDELTATVRAVIDEQRGDTALVAGRLEAAAVHYRAALDHGVHEARRRQLQIKLLATEDPELAPLVADYFGPFQIDDDSRAAAMLRLWAATEIAALPGHRAVGHYLLGLQFLLIAAPEQAAAVLDEALAPPIGQAPLPSPEIRRAALLAQLSARTQTNDWAGARALLEPLEQLAEGEGHRMVAHEWRERIAFFEGYFADSN